MASIAFIQLMAFQGSAQLKLAQAVVVKANDEGLVSARLTPCGDLGSIGLEDLNLASNGVRVANLGPDNLHNVSVYHADPGSNSVTKLRTGGLEEKKEIRGGNGACFTSSTDLEAGLGSAFILRSDELELVSEVA